MDSLIKIAINELGEKEIPGEPDNPVIVNYAKEAGFSWFDGVFGSNTRTYLLELLQL